MGCLLSFMRKILFERFAAARSVDGLAHLLSHGIALGLFVYPLSFHSYRARGGFVNSHPSHYPLTQSGAVARLADGPHPGGRGGSLFFSLCRLRMSLPSRYACATASPSARHSCNAPGSRRGSPGACHRPSR